MYIQHFYLYLNAWFLFCKFYLLVIVALCDGDGGFVLENGDGVNLFGDIMIMMLCIVLRNLLTCPWKSLTRRCTGFVFLASTPCSPLLFLLLFLHAVSLWSRLFSFSFSHVTFLLMTQLTLAFAISTLAHNILRENDLHCFSHWETNFSPWWLRIMSYITSN